ncbi:hypothetical protein WJX72_002830 [[Myrmecia] bisecta]|uniref:Exportin-T n=1 Tax=[Myrmecia] bisecta TaxID=41462 RepID=A0AAW1PRX8_9CHLO
MVHDDDFEKAILFNFDQSGRVSRDLKEQAQAYCNEVKRSDKSWRLYAERFSVTAYVEVKFFCLQALQEFVKTQYAGLDEESRRWMKQTLMVWIQNADAVDLQQMPAFLQNKLAQIIVAVVQLEYPDQWPSFFEELLGLLSSGPAVVSMFCRIMQAVDEDIISLEIPRSQDEIRSSMHLKDAMRERCMTEIAEAWYALVATYHTSNVQLAAEVLDAAVRYVNWIDIGLLANDRFVPLLFGVLSSSSQRLRCASIDVLTEIVSKRMDAVAKMGLVQQLGIVPICAGLPGLEPGDETAARLAKLLAVLAGEILRALAHIENQVEGLAAVGLAVDAEATGEAEAACGAAQELLNQLFPAVLASMRSTNDLAVVPFLLNYVGRLKAVQKKLGSIPQAPAQHVKGILEAVAFCSQFPPESASFAVLAASQADAVAGEEEEAAVLDKRQDLFTLFRNLARVAPPDTFNFVGARLQQGLAARATFQEVEIAISLLYQLGEGAADETLKPGSGALGQLVAGVMSAEVPHAGHRLVALALLETYVRYSRVLPQQQELIPHVLAAFLGPRGMGHGAQVVSVRACYLFARLVKLIRPNLLPLIPDIVKSMQPHLAHIASTPSVDGGSRKSATSAKAVAALPAATDDRLYAFEALGLLLGQEGIAAEPRHAWVAATLTPLGSQIEAHLASAGQGSEGQQAAGVALVLQGLEAITRFSKGFSLAFCTRIAPEIGQVLADTIEPVLRVPRALAGCKAVRARFISYLHRMVECLGGGVLPHLAAALEVLLWAGADAGDIAEVTALLNQLMLRFKDALQALLTEVLPVCVARIHAVLTPDWDWSGRAALPAGPAVGAGAAAGEVQAGLNEDLREKAELQRSYYSFLHAVTHNQLTGALVAAPGQAGMLEAVLEALARGAGSHADPATRRTCVQVLRRLVVEVCGGAAGAPDSFRRFMLERLGGQVCFLGLLRSGLDVRDANTNSLLLDIAGLLKLLHQQCGEELTAFLCASVFPVLALPQQLQEQLIGQVSSAEAKDLRASLRTVLQQVSGVNPGKKASARRSAAQSSSECSGMVS